MSRRPEEKFVSLFEAAKRSFLIADKTYRDLVEVLVLIGSKMSDQQNIDKEAATALTLATVFVDFAHRFGSLIDSLPLINKKTLEVRLLATTLERVESARHHLQHMRGDLASSEHVTYPILGSLSWAEGDGCYIVSFSQPGPVSTPGLAFDTLNKCWVCKREYRVRDIGIDLDETISTMRRTFDWVRSRVQFSDPKIGELDWGQTSAVFCRFVFPNDQSGDLPADCGQAEK